MVNFEVLKQEMRMAYAKASEASTKYNIREAQIRISIVRRAEARGWKVGGDDFRVALKLAKDGDTQLKDHYAAYAFWRDESNRIANRILAEEALVRVARHAGEPVGLYS